MARQTHLYHEMPQLRHDYTGSSFLVFNLVLSLVLVVLAIFCAIQSQPGSKPLRQFSFPFRGVGSGFL